MSFNLLDLVKDQITGSLVEKAAGFVGESTGTTSSALASIVPSLIGSLAGKAGDASGLAGVMNLLKTDGLADSLGNVSNLFGGDSSSLGLGSSLVSNLLGDKLGSITSLIGKTSGASEAASGTLLKMVAPLVLGTLAKKVVGDKLSINGLKDLLMGQKDLVADKLPAGFSSSLGIKDFASGAVGSAKGAISGVSGAAKGAVSGVSGAAKGAVSGASGAAKGAISGASGAAKGAISGASDTVEKAGGGFKKILPLLLLAGLGLAAFLLWNKCSGTDAAVSHDDNGQETTHVATTEGHGDAHTTEHTTTTTEHTAGTHTEGTHTEATHTTTSHTTGDHGTMTKTEGAAHTTTTGDDDSDDEGDFVEETYQFDRAAKDWGVVFSDAGMTAGEGVTMTKETLAGVPVTVFKSASGAVTKIFKDKTGVETVIVKEATGKIKFFQKIGNTLKRVRRALAFKNSPIKPLQLLKGLKALDGDAKGAKGLLK